MSVLYRLVFYGYGVKYVSVARTVVNNDEAGGTAFSSAGSLPEKRKVMQAFSNHAVVLGLDHIWGFSWVGVCRNTIDAADVAACPFSASMSVKVVSLLDTLQWPFDADNLGVGGISFVEVFI